jgi:hypothetical protein
MNVRFQHSHADRGDDLYETPGCATHAIMREGILAHRVWECAAGRGAIVRPLRDAGHAVFASDIIHRDFPLDAQIDFLKATAAPPRTEMILSNPPFRHATEFVEHALELCPRVPMMHRDGWTGPRATNAVPFAWFYFDRRNSAPATIEHISIHDEVAE